MRPPLRLLGSSSSSRPPVTSDDGRTSTQTAQAGKTRWPVPLATARAEPSAVRGSATGASEGRGEGHRKRTRRQEKIPIPY